MFLNENKITFKDKFTTIDIKKKKLETILTPITLEHPKFSQKRENKQNKKKGKEKRKGSNYNKSP